MGKKSQSHRSPDKSARVSCCWHLPRKLGLRRRGLMRAEKSIRSSLEFPATGILCFCCCFLPLGWLHKLRPSSFHPALSRANLWRGRQQVETNVDVSLLVQKRLDWTYFRGASDLAVPVTATPLRKCHSWMVMPQIPPSFRVSGNKR